MEGSYKSFNFNQIIESMLKNNLFDFRYIQCMHQKLYHLTAGDYEEFASIVCAARAAFQINPEGNTQFKEWLQSIKR